MFSWHDFRPIRFTKSTAQAKALSALHFVITFTFFVGREYTYDQAFSILVSGDATINKNQFKFEFQNEKQNQTFEHHYDLPGIGLEPESAKLLTDRSFLDFESELLRTQLTANLKDLWRNQFCRVSAHDVEAAPYAESVLRCLNADLNPVPKFVDD